MKKFQIWVFILSVPLVFGPGCQGPGKVGGDVPLKISGTVRDPSGTRAAGVVVAFEAWNFFGAPEYTKGLTDQKGRYELALQNPTGVRSGPFVPYLVTAPDRGPYATAPSAPFMLTNRILARNLERNLAVIKEFPNQPHTINLKLQPGITVSGSVKDSRGAPLAGAQIDLGLATDLPGLVTTADPGGKPVYVTGGRDLPVFYVLKLRPVKADAQGSYSIPALPRGYYYGVKITAPGCIPATCYVSAKGADASPERLLGTVVLNRAESHTGGSVMGPGPY